MLYCTYSVDMLDKRIIHVLGGTEQDGARFNYVTQNGVGYKSYEILQLTMVTETGESKNTDKVGLL